MVNHKLHDRRSVSSRLVVSFRRMTVYLRNNVKQDRYKKSQTSACVKINDLGWPWTAITNFFYNACVFYSPPEKSEWKWFYTVSGRNEANLPTDDYIVFSDCRMKLVAASSDALLVFFFYRYHFFNLLSAMTLILYKLLIISSGGSKNFE